MNKPNFTVKGENNEGIFEITPKNFFKVSRINRTIIVGVVTEGEIKNGDSIIIKSTSQNLFIEGFVTRIERERKEIPYATRNEVIGVCLSRGIGFRKLKFIDNPSIVSDPTILCREKK